jgi:hypothetical protein
MLNKRQWLRKHGVKQHNKKFAELGWNWTPVFCRCLIPCILDVDNNKK